MAVAPLAAYGASVFVPLTRTPYDAGRYTVAVAHSPLPRGGLHYTVTVRLKEGRWPLRLDAALMKIDAGPRHFDAFEKRGLHAVERGRVRIFAFDVTRAEVSRWSFELDEYAEADGHLMPGLNGLFFALSRPPKP